MVKFYGKEQNITLSLRSILLNKRQCQTWRKPYSIEFSPNQTQCLEMTVFKIEVNLINLKKKY